jgi:hypothetical protein
LRWYRFWSANWLEGSIQFQLHFGSLVLTNNNISENSEVRVMRLNFRIIWWVEQPENNGDLQKNFVR